MPSEDATIGEFEDCKWSESMMLSMALLGLAVWSVVDRMVSTGCCLGETPPRRIVL
jgi:hypothetical protein